MAGELGEGDDVDAWLSAWREGMRRRGFPDARLVVWEQRPIYVAAPYPDPRRSQIHKDDALAVFLSVDFLRPDWVDVEPVLGKLLRSAQAMED